MEGSRIVLFFNPDERRIITSALALGAVATHAIALVQAHSCLLIIFCFLRLLADVDRKVADLYGAQSLIPGKVARSVFVIDAKGVLRYRDVRPLGLFRPKDDEVIRAIREAQK